MMDLELTISGLWVVVLKSKEDWPAHPDAVDVVIPNALHHRPVLSYYPEQVTAEVVPGIAIDPRGRRIAALDLTGKVIKIECKGSQVTQFSLGWVGSTQELPPPADAMNWVPTLKDIGFADFELKPDGTLPAGASARVRLPKGELVARNVVKEEATGGHALWEFKTGKKQAIGNEMVLTVRGCTDVIVWEGPTASTKLLRSTLKPGTFVASVSNDLAMVPKDYNAGVTELMHLKHFDAIAKLAPPPFKAPKLKEQQRTGKPICNGARMIDKS